MEEVKQAQVSLYTKEFKHRMDKTEESFKKQNELERIGSAETYLKKILFDSGVSDRHELKMWLVSAVASLHPYVNDATKCQKFIDALERNPTSSFAKQIILFASRKIPRHIATLFMHKSSLFRKFFLASERRCVQWFSFRFSGKNEQGALALEQYLFQHRESIWDKLRWRGRRDIPPCVAIQKKNLLMELDLLKTLKLLSKDSESSEPDFWDSDFFKDSLESGEFLELDFDVFANELISALKHKGNERDEILQVLQIYFKHEDFRELSQKLLLLLEDQEILSFLYRLVTPSSREQTPEHYVLSFLLCDCKWDSFDNVLFYTSLATHQRQVLRFLNSDIEEADREKINAWIKQAVREDNQAGYWALRKDLVESRKALELIRFGLLEGWLTFYQLQNMYNNQDDIEKIMAQEGISFKSVMEKPFFESEDRSKRQRHHEKEFVGWRFKSQKDSSPLYSIQDIALYLTQFSVSNLVKEYLHYRR